MERPEVLDRIKKIVLAQMEGLMDLDPDKVTEKASFIDDLGFDSLDNIELIMAMEEEFDIEIPDEEAENCVTVGHAADAILKRLGA